MVDFNYSNLRVPSHETIVTRAVIRRSNEEAWRNAVERDYSNGVDAVRAFESRFSSGNAALRNTVRGKWKYNSGTGFWLGDPDGNGCDDEIATRLTAYQHSYKTAGTDTFKARGLIESNTTAVTVTSQTDLMTYTLPANSISDGQCLRVTGYGTSAGPGGQASLYFGVTPSIIAMGVNFDTDSSAWIRKVMLTRISQTSVRIFHFNLNASNTDSIGAFSATSSDIDFAQNQIIKFRNSTNATSFTQEGMLIEYLP